MSDGTEHPSQLGVNRMHRVMSGERLKYTVVLYMKNGRSYEFQSDDDPRFEYQPTIRETMVMSGGYNDTKTYTRMSDVDFIYCEKNSES